MVPFFAVVVDLLVVSGAVVLAVLARALVDVAPGSLSTPELAVTAPLIVVAWLLVIALAGGYRQSLLDVGVDEYKRLLHASLATASVVGIACYLAKFPLSRELFVALFALGVPALVAGRYFLRKTVHRARARGALLHRVVIAGREGHVDETADVLRRESWLGYDIVGAVTPERTGRATTKSGIPLLGTSSSVAEVALEAKADILFLAGGAFDSATALRRLAWELEHEDVQVVIAPSVTDVSRERVSIRPVGGLPLVHLEKPGSRTVVHRAKRAFDVVAAAGVLVVTAPVFAWMAARARLRHDAPFLRRQMRLGRDGRPFQALTFHTPDPRSQSVLAHLPQLVNVLRGDMSLVGPRPPRALEVARDDEEMSRRLRVRPGMTGLWQVSGRSELSWSEATRLDLYYVDNWSMLQDLTILARTVGTALRARGAH